MAALCKNITDIFISAETTALLDTIRHKSSLKYTKIGITARWRSRICAIYSRKSKGHRGGGRQAVQHILLQHRHKVYGNFWSYAMPSLNYYIALQASARTWSMLPFAMPYLSRRVQWRYTKVGDRVKYESVYQQLAVMNALVVRIFHRWSSSPFNLPGSPFSYCSHSCPCLEPYLHFCNALCKATRNELIK